MVIRTVVGIVLATAVAAAQPHIERGDTARMPHGRIAPVVADGNGRSTIARINGRRTVVTRLTTASDAMALGFTAAELEAFGVFSIDGTVVNALIGYARDAAANVLPDRVTQLRELSRGTVVGYARTNERGQFAYHDLPPGTYIVELLAPAGNVLAVSDALTIASGEIVLTVVQLTASTRSFASWISGATTSAVNTAVQAGVLALESAPAVSPES